MGILEEIREKRQKLESLRAEAEALELELREISAVAEGKTGRAVRLPFGRSQRVKKRRSPGIQAGSTTERALKALETAGKPLTVEEILALILKETGIEVDKATLVSNLSRYVQRDDTFDRVAPNTYGLKKHRLRYALGEDNVST